jgi:hypothetical protein
VAGLDISRGTLAKIEARVRCVSDQELVLLAKALGVRVEELFPGGGSWEVKIGDSPPGAELPPSHPYRGDCERALE